MEKDEKRWAYLKRKKNSFVWFWIFKLQFLSVKKNKETKEAASFVDAK